MYEVIQTVTHRKFGVVDVAFDVAISGGDRGNFRGHPDTWYPPDPPDFDYVDMRVEDDESEHNGEEVLFEDLVGVDCDAINAAALEASTWDVDV